MSEPNAPAFVPDGDGGDTVEAIVHGLLDSAAALHASDSSAPIGSR